MERLESGFKKQITTIEKEIEEKKEEIFAEKEVDLFAEKEVNLSNNVLMDSGVNYDDYYNQIAYDVRKIFESRRELEESKLRLPQSCSNEARYLMCISSISYLHKRLNDTKDNLISRKATAKRSYKIKKLEESREKEEEEATKFREEKVKEIREQKEGILSQYRAAKSIEELDKIRMSVIESKN